jgi:hypothetical protein
VGKHENFQAAVVSDANAGVSGARAAWARIVAQWGERSFDEAGLAKVAVVDIERVLSVIPASAVDRAVTRFVGGEAGDPRFPPKLPELAAEARRIAAVDAADAKARRTWERPRALPRPAPTEAEATRRRELAEEARRVVNCARLKTIEDAARASRLRREEQVSTPRPDDDAPPSDHEAHAALLAARPIPKLSEEALAIFARGDAR